MLHTGFRTGYHHVKVNVENKKWQFYAMHLLSIEWLLRRTVMYVRMSLARVMYTWASMNFFSAFYWKTSHPYLLRGSPANMFSGLLISMQYVTIKSLFAPKFLLYREKIKGSVTVFWLILSKKIDSPWKQNTRFPLATLKCLKCCCLSA